jgi:proteasome lid subunit RPN8/RPN11
MLVRIARRTLDEIRVHSAATAPEEACGLLLGLSDAVLVAVPSANVSDDRMRRFEVDPAVLFKTHRAARATGYSVIGCYHSHPDGPALPSAIDAARAFDMGWIWIIAGSEVEMAFRVVDGGAIEGRFEVCELVVEG